MPARFFFLASIVFAALASAPSGQAQQPVITPDHPGGVYETGQPVKWLVQFTGGKTNSLPYTIRRGGLSVLKSGQLELAGGIGMIEAQLDEPGTLLLEVRAGSERNQRAVGGVVAAPAKIPSSAVCPPDFDSFWGEKIKELQAVPANPKLTAGNAGKPGVDYWKIDMDNIRGTHIHGQLARPTGNDKLPALLIVQWAGVYPLQKSWAVDRAAKGWLVLNIEAHDLPIDEPESFYRDQSNGALKNYPAIGNEDRDTSYFLRMYLSCYRATQYLAERPDWNGKTLAVMGDSQGGQQTLMIAGLHPAITAAMALVPAGCDMLGPMAGRKGGWPQWYDQVAGKDALKVHEASRYYDVVNFAARIKCPVLVGLGLLDETCPPAGVFAAANQIKSPKEVVILPQSGHQDVRGTQAAFRKRRDEAWLPALQQGQPAPVMP